MTERRFSKLKLLEDGHYESENTDSPIAVMPWGGSKGPVSEAYRQLQAQGKSLGWYYTMFLNPLPFIPVTTGMKGMSCQPWLFRAARGLMSPTAVSTMRWATPPTFLSGTYR